MSRVEAFRGIVIFLVVLNACSDRAVQPAAPEAPVAQPQLVLQSSGLHCTETDARLSSGALYQVCVDPAQWNGDIVVFIPGYHDPARAPRLPDVFGESPAVSLFSRLGYAFATTSFRGTGLIEPATWIGGDLLELVGTARTLLTSTTGRATRFVYQVGGSQGGLGTVMAVERYPGTFSGGLAGCGPIGDYRRQIAYVADFRVVFDYFFKDAIPGWPVWAQDLSAGDLGLIDPATWPAAEQVAAAAIDDLGNADRVRQVFGVTRAPTDPADPRTIKGTALGILWYSFRGTNDAIGKLRGSPFGNLDRVYAGSSNDPALNAGVERFAVTADPVRIASLQTSARLLRPLVTIHTTGDPIVPSSQQSIYRNRLGFVSRLLHTKITIERYGHCSFTDAEILGAFAVLVLQVSGLDLVASSRVLPTRAAQAEFLRLSREHGASPVVAP